MRANELKVENYYIDICGSESVWKENSFEHYKTAKVDIKDLKPIPLTEEWLLKWGFFKEKELTFTKEINENKQFSIVLYKNTNNWTFPYYHKVNTLTSFKYIHQLQNLYFALTGEELKIKEYV